jgi:hypothetical protein
MDSVDLSFIVTLAKTLFQSSSWIEARLAAYVDSPAFITSLELGLDAVLRLPWATSLTEPVLKGF